MKEKERKEKKRKEKKRKEDLRCTTGYLAPDNGATAGEGCPRRTLVFVCGEGGCWEDEERRGKDLDVGLEICMSE